MTEVAVEVSDYYVACLCDNQSAHSGQLQLSYACLSVSSLCYLPPPRSMIEERLSCVLTYTDRASTIDQSRQLSPVGHAASAAV